MCGSMCVRERESVCVVCPSKNVIMMSVMTSPVLDILLILGCAVLQVNSETAFASSCGTVEFKIITYQGFSESLSLTS